MDLFKYYNNLRIVYNLERTQLFNQKKIMKSRMLTFILRNLLFFTFSFNYNNNNHYYFIG